MNAKSQAVPPGQPGNPALFTMNDGKRSLIVYCVLGVAGIIALDKFAGLSIGSLFNTLIREAKDLAGRRFTVGAANFLGVLAMGAVTGAYALSPQFAEIVSLFGSAGRHVADSSEFAPLVAIGMLGVTILGSVLVVKAGDRKR